MKVDLDKLPDEYDPETKLIHFEVQTDYLIALFNNGLFKYLSGHKTEIWDLLHTNPSHYWEQNEEFVIIEIDSSILIPKIIYVWEKDKWRKIKDVRTDLS